MTHEVCAHECSRTFLFVTLTASAKKPDVIIHSWPLEVSLEFSGRVLSFNFTDRNSHLVI